MKLPYFLTAEGREIVAGAKANLAVEEGKKLKRQNEAAIQRLQGVIRADTRQKIATVIFAAAGSLAVLTLPHEHLQTSSSEQRQSVTAEPLDAAQETETPSEVRGAETIEEVEPALVMKSKIRIGIRSTPEEKQRMRDALRKALTIVLSDPELSQVYSEATDIEQIVVEDLLQAVREIVSVDANTFAHLDPEKETAHGDALTIAIEDRHPHDDTLLGHKNFMFLRKELLQEGNEHRLLMTLDHELRHMLQRGKKLPRRSEEIFVYTRGIAHMRTVAQALMKRGGGDGVIGMNILSTSIPLHEQRLKSWQDSIVP